MPEPEGPVTRIENVASDGYIEVFGTIDNVAIVVSDGVNEVGAELSPEAQDDVAVALFNTKPLLGERNTT